MIPIFQHRKQLVKINYSKPELTDVHNNSYGTSDITNDIKGVTMVEGKISIYVF